MSIQKSEHDRIESALELAVRFGGIDGGHHKAWVIDQMVRALTGCKQATPDADNFSAFSIESEEYRTLVTEACAGEDGPESYEWSVGITP